MKLTELFDKSMPFEVVVDNTLRWIVETEVKVGDKTRKLSIECFKEHDEEYFWNIAFTMDGEHDLTGDGNEIAIFGTVVNALERFKKERNPDRVCMSAKEDNRAKLYKRMLTRALKGWTVESLKVGWINEISAMAPGLTYPIWTSRWQKDRYGHVTILAGRWAHAGFDVDKSITDDDKKRYTPDDEMEQILKRNPTLPPLYKQAIEQAKKEQDERP